MKRLRVLMGAYACEPLHGSEPAVGWNWALEAEAAGHEVWVITRANNRTSIEAALAETPRPGLHFEYLDLPRPLLALKRRLGYAGLLAYYYLWQLALARRGRLLNQQLAFDLTHHVTFGGDALPSGLALVPVPFVWGPVGGSSHRLPASIELDLSAAERRHERIRGALQFALKHLDPFTRCTRKRAQVILTYTHEALAGLPPEVLGHARPVIHIGVTESEPPPRDFDAAAQTAAAGTRGLRILTGGRLVHWKGYDLLIDGFAHFLRSHPDSEAQLVVTGSGRTKPRLEELVHEHGIDSHVSFVGRVPTRDDLFELMHECDLYALPTLRDGPPVAILEAMACGVPVLCLDLGATAEMVPAEAGFKIEPRSREYVEAEIAGVLALLDNDRELALEMGRKARAYALTAHRWSNIRLEIDRSYEDALS